MEILCILPVLGILLNTSVALGADEGQEGTSRPGTWAANSTVTAEQMAELMRRYPELQETVSYLPILDVLTTERITVRTDVRRQRDDSNR